MINNFRLKFGHIPPEHSSLSISTYTGGLFLSALIILERAVSLKKLNNIAEQVIKMLILYYSTKWNLKALI